MEETLDQISPILPLDFFSLSLDISYVEKNATKQALKKKYQLPDFSDFLFEDPFAKVFMGWSYDGLVLTVQVDKPFEECFFPEVRKGDSVEFFLDMRDLKSTGFLTRFCHHFVITAQPIDGVLAQEVTVFRSDEKHDLCDSQLIEVETVFHKRSYDLKIFIPTECLYGYDPLSFDRVGFSYRINRFGGRPQHFVVSSDYLNIENQPSLWSSMHMRKG